VRQLSAWLNRQPLSILTVVAIAASSATWAVIIYLQAWAVQERHGAGPNLRREPLFIVNVLMCAAISTALILSVEWRRRRRSRGGSPLTAFALAGLLALGTGINGVLTA
jgi:hypothetical protein